MNISAAFCINILVAIEYLNSCREIVSVRMLVKLLFVVASKIKKQVTQGDQCSGSDPKIFII